jgi:hypothetical protein
MQAVVYAMRTLIFVAPGNRAIASATAAQVLGNRAV